MEISKIDKRIIYLIFSLSGTCALIYEVLWTKYLSLTFGNTIFAVSLVAATFMGGLALGSFLFGRYVDRRANLLKIYGFIEIALGLSALAFPFALRVVEHLYVFWVNQLPAHPLLVGSINVIFCAILILPPTICMGGTFPLMCRFFARSKSGGQIGRLYAMNTLGATVGAFSAGYLLLPQIGLSRTGYLAVLGNLGIAVIAILLAKRYGSVDADGVTNTRTKKDGVDRIRFRPILLAIGLVGFFSLAYEILWTRVLLLFLGNTSYAFSLMLSAYLVGISLGGGLFARLVRRDINEKSLFLKLSALLAIVILASAPFYDKLAYLFQFAHEVSGEQWWQLSMFSFLIVFVITGLPTVLSGALLPIAVAVLDPGKNRTGEGVGLVVLHNTLGAVLGSLVAGFLMVPAVGLLDSFRLLAVVNLLLVGILALHYRKSICPCYALPVLFAAGIFLVFIPINWSSHLINSGVYCYAPKYASMGGIDKVLENEKIIEVIEGAETTVAIHESLNGDHRFFTVNGKTDGGTGRDMATQVLVGQLPLLLHPRPEDVLVIGLGTGITLNGMSAHPTKSITCVEISPEVVAAEPYFQDANGNALANPKVDLIVNDGRNLLLTDLKEYDVIVSEPSNPWQTGNSNLFTDDFYRLAASRLKEKGLFCQWIGLYDITEENLKIAVRTFLNNFPKALAFRAGSDLILVGSGYELSFNYQQLRQRFEASKIRQLLASIDIDTPGDLIAGCYLFAEDTLRHFCSDGDILNSDDRPVLEFSARYNLGENILGEFAQRNARALMGARQGKIFLPVINLGNKPQEFAVALRQIGKGFARIGRTEDAATFMKKAKEVLD